MDRVLPLFQTLLWSSIISNEAFQSKIMHLDEIDGELHILDENLDVVHVWTRANGEVTFFGCCRVF